MTHNSQKHAFLVCGTHSGCGKTTLSLGLLLALKARGMNVQPFKVGPDFIDPGLHTQIAGSQSRNLDGWMLSREWNEKTFRRCMAGADAGLIEGVMGLFDGYDGRSESGSSAEMAKWLGAPAVLVVDAKSMARSVAALVQGFVHFDPDLKFAGVIFNRVGGERHLRYLKEALSCSCPETVVLGGIPKEEAVQIPERHLGLVTADEMKLDSRWRDRLAALVEKHIDIDHLLEKTSYSSPPPDSSAGRQSYDAKSPAILQGQNLPPAVRRPPAARRRAEIAVARDAAYCFYYPDNLELLERAGARLTFFSPLSGESLPPQCCGAYLGGGYPELFAGAISRNTAFFDSLRARAAAGMPIYAECGGLMTLGRFIETIEGKKETMAGILPFGTRMLGRLKALGYTEAVLRRECLLGKPGMVIRGHEFHYSEIVEQGNAPGLEFAYDICGRRSGVFRPEGYQVGSVLASYVHLHWGSAPEAAERFVLQCADWDKGR
ncbi:MAG: cobyrinate a,c-diamide synthase [Syntrophobacteraceae bacterium]|nr:cobyrinate a,c-diamide synthase [Syntrophobacteraceae bacterium]